MFCCNQTPDATIMRQEEQQTEHYQS